MSGEIVICPHCLAGNRVPVERLGQHPNCGKCHQPLFLGQPLDVDGAAFAAHVGKGTLPVLVDFWAPWCGPCRAMAPAYAQAAQALEPRFRVLKVDTEAQQTLGAAHRIQSIPTIALFRGGREVKRGAGAMDTRRIVAWAEATG